MTDLPEQVRIEFLNPRFFCRFLYEKTNWHKHENITYT